MALRRRFVAALARSAQALAAHQQRPLGSHLAKLVAAAVLLLAGPALTPSALAEPLAERAAAAESTALVQEAGDYLRQGHLDKALERFVQAAQQRGAAANKLALVKWNPQEAQLLARVWLERGAYEEARTVLQPHAQAKLPPAWLLLLQAQVEGHIGNHADTLKLLTKACQLHPKDLPLRVALGERCCMSTICIIDFGERFVKVQKALRDMAPSFLSEAMSACTCDSSAMVLP